MAKNSSSYQQAGQGEISSCPTPFLSQAEVGLHRLCSLHLTSPELGLQARNRKAQSGSPMFVAQWCVSDGGFESKLGLGDH